MRRRKARRGTRLHDGEGSEYPVSERQQPYNSEKKRITVHSMSGPGVFERREFEGNFGMNVSVNIGNPGLPVIGMGEFEQYPSPCSDSHIEHSVNSPRVEEDTGEDDGEESEVSSVSSVSTSEDEDESEEEDDSDV